MKEEITVEEKRAFILDLFREMEKIDIADLLSRARNKAFLAYWRFQTENLHIAKDSLWVDAYIIKSLKLHPDIAIALKRGIKEKLNLLCQLRIPRFCKGAVFLYPAIIILLSFLL